MAILQTESYGIFSCFGNCLSFVSFSLFGNCSYFPCLMLLATCFCHFRLSLTSCFLAHSWRIEALHFAVFLKLFDHCFFSTLSGCWCLMGWVLLFCLLRFSCSLLRFFVVFVSRLGSGVARPGSMVETRPQLKSFTAGAL